MWPIVSHHRPRWSSVLLFDVKFGSGLVSLGWKKVVVG